jgi:hypothetical protein
MFALYLFIFIFFNVGTKLGALLIIINNNDTVVQMMIQNTIVDFLET